MLAIHQLEVPETLPALTPEQEEIKERIKKQFKNQLVSQYSHSEIAYAVSQAVAQLLSKEPFYGHFLMKFNRRYDLSVPTAAVELHRNKVHLVVNPNWFMALSIKQRVAVIKHEVLHILLAHIVRMGDRDAYLSNIAQDASINQFIENLPEDAIKLDTYKEKYGIVFPPEQAWEIYYELLKAVAAEEHKKHKCNANGTYGEPKGIPGSPSGQDGIFGKTLDDHGKWADSESNQRGVDENGEGTGSDRSFIEELIRQAANEAMREARHAGNLPGYLQKIIDALNARSKINWKKVLRRWFHSHINKLIEPSMRREKRRIDEMFPGRRRFPKPSFNLYIDSSSSVTDQEFAILMTEVDAISKAFKCKVNLFFFHVTVFKEFEYKPGMTIERGEGGTSFDCVFEHAYKRKVKNVIIFTDTGSHVSDYMSIKPLWVITPNAPNAPHLLGQQIRIEMPTEK